MGYMEEIDDVRRGLLTRGKEWGAINPEYVVGMRHQNRFRTGLDIARYTADIMRREWPITMPIRELHPIVGGVARFRCSTDDDVRQETPRLPEQTLYLLKWVDGCRTAFTIRTAARSEHA
ncbi:MAG: hypothetical protein CM1200mP9_11540 [Gammaproteobacteria bacterium]|nr:MAG: hypothetical protein CM1200mP9_11540 [Gammaproteobacteria bacterium]